MKAKSREQGPAARTDTRSAPRITVGTVNGEQRRPLVVDEDDAAAQLGVSPRTMQRWRTEGRGPSFVRLGKLTKYRPGDLEEFVRAGVVPREAA